MGLGENKSQDDKSNIEQYENDMHFHNGRYVTCLLWKCNHENLSYNLGNTKQCLVF